MRHVQRTPNRPSQRRASWWFLATFGLFWAGLLVHEGAHVAVAKVLFAPDDWIRAPAYGDVGKGLAAAAGPLATLVIFLTCAVIAARSREPIAIAAGLGAASRIFLVAVPTLLGRSNDEFVISVVTGVPGPLIWAAEAAVTTAVTTWVGVSLRAEVEVGAVGFSILGIVLGWTSAFTFGRAIGLPV